MKQFLLIGLLFIAGATVAQDIPGAVKLTHYVFDEFTAGTVKLKTGAVSQQKLNYNILTGEMIYDDAGKYLAIAKPADVDTAFIAGRKFIPMNNKFYEVLTSSAAPLLLDFGYEIEEPGAPTGYGNASPTTNATSLKTLIGTGSVYGIKLPDDFKVIPKYGYWIYKEGKLLKANSSQAVTKIYPEKKDVIKELIKKNNTNFSKRADLVALINQLQ